MATKNANKQQSMSEKEKDSDRNGDTESEKNTEKRKSLGRADNSSYTSLAGLFSDEEERQLLGIGFFTIWEAGIFVSGYAGTGIVMSRNIMNGDWSGPVAVGVSGVSAGLLIGASVRSIVYLIYDYFTLQSIIGTDGGVIFGVGAGATIGTWSKDTGKQTAYITSPKTLRTAGVGSNIALCRGLVGIHGAVSVEAGICKTRDKINARFYGKEKLTGSEILLSGEPIEIPNSSPEDEKNVGVATSNYQAKRLMETVHMKLKKLCLREDPQPFQSSSHTEDVKAKLESYDYDDYEVSYEMKINGDDDDNDKNGDDGVALRMGEESNGVPKSHPLTNERTGSTLKSKESDDDELLEEEEAPFPLMIETTESNWKSNESDEDEFLEEEGTPTTSLAE